jgi:hypothetical protein
MPCGLFLAAALAASPATTALTSEPLFAEIVAKAEALETEALTLKGSPAADLGAFTTKISALSALDMQAHLTLKARGVDGDLKCILKGISEDLPKKVAALAEAKEPFARGIAADEIVALLDDNAQVILQPPGPATPPPAE